MIFDGSVLARSSRRAVVAPLIASLAACGGGGSDPPEEVWSGVTIETPTEAASFTTDQPAIDLAGRSFVPTGSVCNAIVGTIAEGYRVRWRNAASASEQQVDQMQLNCLIAVSLTWEVRELPLALGDNAITVTASASDGEVGRDTINVHRIVDTTPPAVTGSTPSDGAAVPSGFTSISVDFTEPVDTSSGSFMLRDETIDTPITLFPWREGTAVDLGNVTLVPAHAYVLQVSGVRDRSGNAMTTAFTSRFSTAP